MAAVLRQRAALLGHILALLHLALRAVVGGEAQEAHLLLALCAVGCLELNAFFGRFDRHNSFANFDCLGIALRLKRKITSHGKKSSSPHLVDICAHLLRNGLTAPLRINRPTLLAVPTSGSDRTRGGELGVDAGGRVRLDADLLLFDLAVHVLVVVALGARRRGTFGFSHVDADLEKVC